MKYLFPDLDTLLLTLSSGELPDSITLAPASYGLEDGKFLIEPQKPLTSVQAKKLLKLGVRERKTGAVPFQVFNWLQIVPLQRRPELLTGWNEGGDSHKTPVLFELSDTEMLPELVGEILRLGNDRQAFRYVSDQGAGWVLLRVVGPPYYSLLRALEREPGTPAPYAYREQVSRVWVQLGYEHPLVKKLVPPVGQLLLIREDGDWAYVEEAPFQEIYSILEYHLPEQPRVLKDTELEKKISVPLRLTRGSSHDNAELWVVERNSGRQLDELVSTASDRLLAQLMFAVVERPGQEPVVILRARQSREEPPVLVLDCTEYVRYFKVDNLYLPARSRLHPPLQRDAVVERLARDKTRLTWLRPDEQGDGFVPQQVPDSAFRPLSDWVEYVLDREHQPLQTWVQTSRFHFDAFICPEDQEERAKREQRNKKGGPNRRGPGDLELDEQNLEKFKVTPRKPTPTNRRPAGLDPQPLEKVTPSQLQVRLRELETAFRRLIEQNVAPEAPERQELWREMALVNARMGQSGDATTCWMNVLWEDHDWSLEDLARWLACEQKREQPDPLNAPDLDRILKLTAPAPSDLNILCAHLTWMVFNDRSNRVITHRLGQIQEFLQQHEHLLAVRVAWLGWLAYYHLSGRDDLALARARDRILERLYANGLSPDRELPSFLRASGVGAGERFRAVRERVIELHDQVQRWKEYTFETTRPVAWNEHYINLIFAYGLARLGESTQAAELLYSAEQAMLFQPPPGRPRDPKTKPSEATNVVHDWLCRAYGYRIRQALANQPHTGQLPGELLESLNGMEAGVRYMVDRQRQQSSILEPHEKIEPYRKYLFAGLDSLDQELTALFDVNDRGELADKLNKLRSSRADSHNTPSARSRILGTALELSVRLGENHALPLLKAVDEIYKANPNAVEKANLLDKALHIAAHFGQPEYVQQFVASFQQLLLSQRGADEKIIEALSSLLTQSFRGLRKLGMRDEIALLLDQMAVLIRGEGAAADTKAKGKKQPETPAATESPETMRLLMGVVSGWFYFGQADRCWPELERVRRRLYHADPIGQMDARRTVLACAYITALGQAPVENAIPLMQDLFVLDGDKQNVPRLGKIGDNFTTNAWFSRSQLNVAEALILALVSDDFSLDKTGRRWLDDDEFRIRRRIHNDVRAATAKKDK